MFTYYVKSAAIIARHPIMVASHPKAGRIIVLIAQGKFRLHWLRDVARGQW